MQVVVGQVTLALCIALVAHAAEMSPYREAAELCRFKDARIGECSGLASGSRSEDYFFVHNDSGGEPVFYAVRRDGETLARFRVKGASAIDWEDMARGPGPKGKPALFLGDIGDNSAKRSSITVYRVQEPDVDSSRIGVEEETETATQYDLEYEDGPHDAEALLVHPKTGQLFVVTKSPRGSGVYTTHIPLHTGSVNRIEKVAEIRFSGFPVSAGAIRDSTGALLATGGSISPDGRHLVVRTYTDAYEWKIKKGNVVSAFQGKAAHIPMPPIRSGEAIGYSNDSLSLLASNEGLHAPVFEIHRKMISRPR